MSEDSAIMFANDLFYEAFRQADVNAMDEVWARDRPVVCIHPGWPALTSRRAILESWTRIFSAGGPHDIRCLGPRVLRLGEEQVLVVSYESLAGTALVATNGFVAEGKIWRMVLHQAGPCNALPEDEPEDVEGGTA